jgi:hypothetical protein
MRVSQHQEQRNKYSFAPRQGNLCMLDCTYVYPEVRQNEVPRRYGIYNAWLHQSGRSNKGHFLIEGRSLSKSPMHAKACPRSVILCYTNSTYGSAENRDTFISLLQRLAD